MTSDRELMQLALEAMGAVGADLICQASHHAKKDQHQWNEPCPLQQRWHIAFQALRERLAQPEQEPVAHVDHRIHGWPDCFVMEADPPHTSPLYTTPPRREWAGLDRKEMLSIIDQQQAYKKTGLPMFYRDQCLDMLRAIEAKLKEKNGRVDSFLRRLLDPEDLGHAVSHEVRQKVRELL